MSKGILLFGHGARNAEYIQPFLRIKAAMQARNPLAKIEIGFLELMQPTFEEAVDALIRQGVDDIRIVPIFFAPGKHVLKDLPERAGHILDRHPDLKLDVAEAVGMVPAVIEAMADYALAK